MENKVFLIDLEQLSALQMDSINGFRQLSEKVERPDLKAFFTSCELQSSELWDDLKNEIIKRKGEVKTHGSLKGAMNHLWMKLKTDVMHSDLPEVLKNIKFCEEFNIASYKIILTQSLPAQLKTLLDKHHAILQSRLDKISEMQKQFENDGNGQSFNHAS